jgi:riboflavin-specific deaminase-like protein
MGAGPEAPLRRLLPEPGSTTVGDLLDDYDPREQAPEDRPFLFTNFALTVDGRATIDGRSGAIGTDTDTAMLVGLRTRAEAVMIGAGTLRAEGYGRVVADPAKREARVRRGLSPDPLTVIVSNRLDIPWEAPLFTDGGGEVLIFTATDAEAPATETQVEIVRHEGAVDLAAALLRLRADGIRSLLCEGGPTLHARLIDGGFVDELFVTRAPALAGGTGPGLTEGLGAGRRALELLWLNESGGELYARYRIR